MTDEQKIKMATRAQSFVDGAKDPALVGIEDVCCRLVECGKATAALLQQLAKIDAELKRVVDQAEVLIDVVTETVKRFESKPARKRTLFERVTRRG